jgi:hypothetical protein
LAWISCSLVRRHLLLQLRDPRIGAALLSQPELSEDPAERLVEAEREGVVRELADQA